MQPQVSVIIPFYNRADIIKQTIDSILSQTFRDFELLCVDDGSTEPVVPILEQYAQKDARVRVFPKPHTNVGDTRNFGYQQSCGQYVFFLDADDLFAPDFFQTMVQTITTTQSDVVACLYDEFDHQTQATTNTRYFKTVVPEQEVTTLSRTTHAHHWLQLGYDVTWNKIFRRDIIDQYHLQFPNVMASDDIFFTFNYLAHCNQITLLDRVLIHRRCHDPRSLTQNFSDQFLRCQVMDDIRAQWSDAIWQDLRPSYYQKYFAISLSAIQKSDYTLGKKIFQHARQVLHHQKIQVEYILQSIYKNCLRFNKYDLFYDFLCEKLGKTQ